MDLQGLGYIALFLVLIAPSAWYLRRQIGRIGEPLKHNGSDSVRQDSDAVLARYGYRLKPEVSEHLRRSVAEGPAYYQERFRTAPIGNWHADGNEPMLMATYWEFRPDHTGEVLSTAVMGYPDCRVLFQWREVDDYTIDMLVTARQNCTTCPAEGPPEWEDEIAAEHEYPEAWERVSYEFQLIPGERAEIGMYQVGQHGFYPLSVFSEGPLCLDWP